jgi:hypothetical protein
MTDDSVYDAMAGDIYGQGKVLALRKYKFLKWSYMSFLLGMMGAVIVFLCRGVWEDDLQAVINYVMNNMISWDDVKDFLCMLSYACRSKLVL